MEFMRRPAPAWVTWLIGWACQISPETPRQLTLISTDAEIRAGDSVVADPSGRRLIVQVQESSHSHQFSVPLDGGPEREIPPDSSFAVGPLAVSSKALHADGQRHEPRQSA
jgi:hypothetical protein